MPKLTFNREPYFDDFDESKNFYQILFRPSRAIQTRELNQLQTILGFQSEQFANHIFKFGSMVKSGSVRFKNYTPYVRLKDLTPTAENIDVTRFNGRRVRGDVSGLLAEVIFTSPKDDFDPATIFVEYLNSAIDGETSAFVNGEKLQVLDDQGFVIYEATVRCPDCTVDPDADTVDPTGFGSLFAIEESAYYVHGKFVPTPLQMIILDKYGTTPSYKVGFDIVQSVVSADDDISLLDNALGTPNFTAPGADRYKINLVLTKKPLDDEDDENFVLLAKVDAGYLQEVKDKPQYAELMDTLARRTYDESGDYTVTPFTINFREHLKENNNGGWKEASEGGDESKFVTVVSPGKSYVRGREIEVISDRIVEVEKARDSETKRSSVVRPYFGNYITVTLDAVSNTLPITDVTGTDDYVIDFEKVSLYNGPTSGGNYTGDQIGTARVKGMELHSGVAGDPAAVYKLYIFEIVFGSGYSIADLAGIHRTGGGSQTFAANIEPDPSDGVTNKIYEPINNNLLYQVPFSFTKSIRDADNPLVSNTSVTVMKKLVGAVNSQNKVVFSAEGDETFLNFDALKWVGGLQTSPGGNFLPYDLTQLDKIVVTPSEITIQNMDAGDVGKNFVLTCEVLKSNAKEKTKVLDTVFLNGLPGDVNELSLQYPDVYRVVSVIDVTSGDPQTYVDVTSNYNLDNGIRDNYYDTAKITLKAGLQTPDPGTLLDIEFEYFQHVGNGYYFSVDSYTSIVNDPDLDFDYEDIPEYTTKEGTKFRMSDTLDFRPTVGGDGTFSGVGAVLSNMPVDESNIIFDIEYYLPRIDLLCLREDGTFIPVKGNPDLDPDVPKAAENSMGIYEIRMDAYTFDVKKNVRMKYLDNKRYTMRDIGKLERRISNLEYYVTFNLLEKATADTSILDSDGNERFKNGFLVDNFKDFIASDTGSPEYNASLDTVKGELRPSFLSQSVKVAMDDAASSHYQKTSKILTLPYSETVWMDQPFATKTISVNPYFIWNQQGVLVLNPESDVWKDVQTEPDLVVEVDTGWEDIRDVANAAGVLGTNWGSWRTTGSNTRRGWNTITTTTQQTRTGVNRSIEEQINEVSLGEYVTSVNIIPYCRSVPVQFAATGLKPRTKVYAYFDDVDCTEDCRPMNGSTNEDLVTDDTGSVVGVFTIPNREDKRFFTGTRIFRLTNMANNSKDPDELTTSAEAQFFAGGLQETRRETVLAVSTPALIETEINQQRTVSRTQQIRRSGDDPLAQSFTVEDETGVFLTGVDLYFSEKDAEVPVWFQIRNMVNGYPGPVIVPMSEVHKKPENVNVSEDASVATRFQFEAPVYLQADEEYCFVVGSDVETYRIYVSKLGSQTVGSNPVTVSTQPHLGSLFKSQNDKTWTAEQYEDIKFQIHRADFDISQNLSVVFNNTDYGIKSELGNNPLETENASRMVRVYMKNHGFVANDKAKIEMLQDTWYEIHLQSGNLVVGQQLVGGTNGATAIIKDLIHDGLDGGNNNVYRVQLSELKGTFANAEQFTGPVHYEQFDNAETLAALDIPPNNLVHNVAVGSFPTGVDNTFNGIPLTDLSTPEHLVQYVDSMDSFVIQVDTPATATGRVGGTGVYCVGNIQVDSFEFQVNALDFTGEATWDVDGIKHGGVGSNVTNYASAMDIPFIPNETKYLVEPLKIANKTNEDMNLGGAPSIVINGVMNSDDSRVSPVLNMDTVSFTSITNRVDWNDCGNFSVAPNADTEGNPVICDPDDVAYTGTTRWKQETSFDGGSEGAKYIMKPVTLETPATNLKVYMDLLNFLDTEVQIFYRTLPAESDDEIKNMTWVQAALDAEVVSQTDTEFNEAEVTIPPMPTDILPEFKSFQVKLVLRSQNSARPPKVKNFRAIAVL